MGIGNEEHFPLENQISEEAQKCSYIITNSDNFYNAHILMQPHKSNGEIFFDW